MCPCVPVYGYVCEGVLAVAAVIACLRVVVRACVGVGVRVGVSLCACAYVRACCVRGFEFKRVCTLMHVCEYACVSVACLWGVCGVCVCVSVACVCVCVCVCVFGCLCVWLCLCVFSV